MKRLTVILSENLSEKEIRHAEEAIGMIRGVIAVNEDSPGVHQSYVPPETDYRNAERQNPAQGYQNEPPRQQQYQQPPQQNYGQQQPQQNYGQQPPQQNYGQQPHQNSHRQEVISEQKQRNFISDVIKLGVKKGKITLQELERMTPEETVKMAMSLSDSMTDEEKSALARKIER